MKREDLLILRAKTLIENPRARVPICLVLDASYSMGGIVSGDTRDTGRRVTSDGKTWSVVEGDNLVTRMDELNQGISQFYSELLDDEDARDAAEVSIVAFAAEAQIIQDFGPIDESLKETKLKVSDQGETSLGRGVQLALDLLDQRKKEYNNAGVDYFQPWMVIITDGQPTDQTHLEIREEIEKRVNGRKLTVFPIAVGDLKDYSQLALLSPKRKPLKLQGAKFRELFEWLSKSVAQVSVSLPGESTPIDLDGLQDWAEL